jgi:hypothetical protein
MTGVAHQKVNAGHLKRNAYLYVRQSTLRQVFENTESTKRQYGLRQHAVALGWPVERIIVIDSDLGQSGASAVDREGFQKLVTEVSFGQSRHRARPGSFPAGAKFHRLAPAVRNLRSHLAHRVIDVISDHSLADRYGVLDAVTLADVLGHEAVLTRVVSDRHSAPADATDYQTLQQRGAFAWRTLATVCPDGLRVFAKALQILFILLPGDVAGVSILE